MTNFMTSIFLLPWMIMLTVIMMIMIKMLHPIIMIFLIIMLNTSTCIMMSLWKHNYMYSLLIFLIMISGLLIMFMYFASLISNEQLKFNALSNTKLSIFIIMNLLIMHILLLMKSITSFLYHPYMEISPINFLLMNKMYNIMNMYLYPLNNFTMLTIIFILITFISIIKINSSYLSHSLRKIM